MFQQHAPDPPDLKVLSVRVIKLDKDSPDWRVEIQFAGISRDGDVIHVASKPEFPVPGDLYLQAGLTQASFIVKAHSVKHTTKIGLWAAGKHDKRHWTTIYLNP